MSENLEIEKWNILFESDQMLEEGLHDGYLKLVFRIKVQERGRAISENTLKEIKEDLLDLGKWRKYKELKKDLQK